jgi:hypothetical protein
MHGVNTAARSARAIRRPAPQSPFSPDPASKPACSPQALSRPEPDPRYGLSLARTDCASRRLRPGVKAPDLQLPIRNPRLHDPFGLSAPPPRPVCPDLGRFFASRPLPRLRSLLPALPKTFTPHRGSCPPTDQRSVSVQPVSPPPDPPDLPSLPTAHFVMKHRRLRIIVPGPLRFRKLAVPQTSWNHLDYDPDRFSLQDFFVPAFSFSSRNIFIVNNNLWDVECASAVDKTPAVGFVLP